MSPSQGFPDPTPIENWHLSNAQSFYLIFIPQCLSPSVRPSIYPFLSISFSSLPFLMESLWYICQWDWTFSFLVNTGDWPLRALCMLGTWFTTAQHLQPLFYFETGWPVGQADPEFAISCLNLPNSWALGVHHHPWLNITFKKWWDSTILPNKAK